jgi:UDP-N-acetylmuramate dehydrogenase
VADAGVEAVVVRLAGAFRQIDPLAGDQVRAGGGASNQVLVSRAIKLSLSGLEFAEGIPGTVGGSVRMNAGGYEGSFGSRLVRALVVTAEGSDWRSGDEIQPSYRKTALHDGEVVVAADLQLVEGERTRIKAAMDAYADHRRKSQPVKERTFGSVFVNPNDEGADQSLPSAWQAIAACAQVRRLGEARISEKHANFIENLGGATAADVVSLMAAARERVWTEIGIALRPEVVFFGDISLPPLRESDQHTN